MDEISQEASKPKSGAKKKPDVAVPLAPNTTVSVAPATGYYGCMIVGPDDQATAGPGTPFKVVVYVSAVYSGPVLQFQTPNSDGYYLVQVTALFSGQAAVQAAILAAGLPDPPVVVT